MNYISLKPSSFSQGSALVRYKAGDGNGDPSCTRNYVTKDTPPLKLVSWLHCQRSVRKGTRKRRLSVEQVRRLEELCVWWNRNNKGGTSSLVWTWSSLQYTRKIYCNGNFIFFADFIIHHKPYTNEPYIHSFSSQILHYYTITLISGVHFLSYLRKFLLKKFSQLSLDTLLKLV